MHKWEKLNAYLDKTYRQQRVQPYRSNNILFQLSLHLSAFLSFFRCILIDYTQNSLLLLFVLNFYLLVCIELSLKSLAKC